MGKKILNNELIDKECKFSFISRKTKKKELLSGRIVCIESWSEEYCNESSITVRIKDEGFFHKIRYDNKEDCWFSDKYGKVEMDFIL